MAQQLPIEQEYAAALAASVNHKRRAAQLATELDLANAHAKRLMDERDDLIESNRELREAVETLHAEIAGLAGRVKELEGYIDQHNAAVVANMTKADTSPIVIIDTPNTPGATPEAVASALHISVIAEIEPRHDPVYGHIFTWPAQEVDQFFALGDQADAAPQRKR